MIDVFQMPPPISHLISLSNGDAGEGLIRWSVRTLHTYRKTLCAAEFLPVDRRLYSSIESMAHDHEILAQLHKCDACSVLLQFALANSYFRQIDYSDGEVRFGWQVLPTGSFTWLREELKAK